MKKLLDLLDRWAAKAIQVVRPGKHKSSNVLTDDVHIKERKIPFDEEMAYEQERVILPDQYYVTRTGQTMRKPVKARKNYRGYKVRKKNNLK